MVQQGRRIDINLVIESTCIRSKFNFFENYFIIYIDRGRGYRIEHRKGVENISFSIFYRTSSRSSRPRLGGVHFLFYKGMSEELKFKLWIEYPELREELFGNEEDEDNDIF